MIVDFQNEHTGKIFGAVLERMPTSDRIIIEQWVMLATDKRERAAKYGGDVAAKASASASGVVFIDSDGLKGEHWRFVEAVIAHELAHVRLGHHRASKATVGYVEGECQANDLAVSWGYPSLVSYDTLHPQRVGGLPKTFGEIEF